MSACARLGLLSAISPSRRDSRVRLSGSTDLWAEQVFRFSGQGLALLHEFLYLLTKDVACECCTGSFTVDLMPVSGGVPVCASRVAHGE